MEIWRQAVLFYLGGAGYMGLELLFRGRTHGSMFLAGGACFLLVGKQRTGTLPLRMLRGGAIITAVELGAGLLFNRAYQVWDYRNLPLNFRGQICLPFSLLWVPLSWCAESLYHRAEKLIKS